ncbi:hypothetical protein ACFY8B_09385 [Streptomyces sp. NPDC012751]|uniref:hypothetical protein n=1 Tax=Streptomyces sp. NPDC012751 TaxID=3364846 RepID=UPI0036CA45DC
MTRRVPSGTPTAVLTAVLLGALAACGGSDGPSALEKELGRECEGRVSADSVDVRLPEGATAEVISTWHRDGQGQCWVAAKSKSGEFEPFALEVIAAADAEAAEKSRQDDCTRARTDSRRHTLYSAKRDYCSSYSLSTGRYEAHGAIGRYDVGIHLLGARPVEGVDAPLKKARAEIDQVMDDLRAHYRKR